MPACGCALCRANREGRLDELMGFLAMDIACPHLVTRRVRTLGHPFKGVRECANCYSELPEAGALRLAIGG